MSKAYCLIVTAAAGATVLALEVLATRARTRTGVTGSCGLVD